MVEVSRNHSSSLISSLVAGMPFKEEVAMPWAAHLWFKTKGLVSVTGLTR